MTALLLAYRDLEAARDLFVDALGFTEEWRGDDDHGALARVHVRLGDTVLLLGRPGDHGIRSPAELGGLTHVAVISVGDVDAHHAKAAAAGAPVHGPPVDRPWGREYELTDPGGYLFAFVE